MLETDRLFMLPLKRQVSLFPVQAIVPSFPSDESFRKVKKNNIKPKRAFSFLRKCPFSNPEREIGIIAAVLNEKSDFFLNQKTP